jgi:ribonucleotide reductase alpha subunit
MTSDKATPVMARKDTVRRVAEEPVRDGVMWGPIGKEVYQRTYSRLKPDGTQEDWADTVDRVVDGNLGLVNRRHHEPGERTKLIDLIKSMDMLPAGRHLWSSGVPGRQFLFNCHSAGFSRKDLAGHFTFLFDELMKGGGVGSNYSNRFIEIYPPIFSKVDFHIVCNPDHPNYMEMPNLISKEYNHHSQDRFMVEDSREGWCSSLSELLLAAWHGKDTPLIIDVSMLRERGALLKSFGGKSSGPAPLVAMLASVGKILNDRVGHKLSSLDVMAIDHEVATCVVSGNIRRSARMSIKYWADKDVLDFIRCKTDSHSHWSTNISVEVDDEFFRALRKGDAKAKKVLHEACDNMRKNGEPGFWNSSLSAVGEVEQPFSTNPCGEISMVMWENCFSGNEKFITREYGSVCFEDVVGQTITVQTPDGWRPAVVSRFGDQKVQKVTFVPVRWSTGAIGHQKTRSDFRVQVTVTPNHRWEKVDGQVSSALAIGDVVPMNAASFEQNEDYQRGVQHGVMFGDGCADRQYADGEWRHRARLFGGKAQEMAGYFPHLTFPKSCKGAPEAWLKTSLNLKDLPEGTEGSDYLAGFVDGWGMADANERPNGSLHLGSSHPDAEEWLKNHAASAGWVLRAAKDSGTDGTNFGPRKNRLKFFTLSRPKEELAWEVESIEELPGMVPVYCATVPGVERFTLASGIATMNCNLGHINLERFAGRDAEAREAFRLMSRFLVRATFGDVLSDYQKQVQSKNRRIGVGFFGFHPWLVYQGVRFSESHHNKKVRERLKSFYQACRDEARKYAFELRMPEPIKVTTIAPTGTISNLPGTTSGCQPIFARYFKRRVNYASNDLNLKDLETQGFPIEDSVYTKNTKVVTFCCKDPLVDACEQRELPLGLIEEQSEISVSDHLAVQSMLQDEYSDNGISYTINCTADVTIEEIEQAMKAYLPHLKGTTIMPEGESRPQTPLERITKEVFEEAERKGLAKVSDAERACLNGSCPVK